jgi:hypothetical protein
VPSTSSGDQKKSGSANTRQQNRPPNSQDFPALSTNGKKKVNPNLTEDLGTPSAVNQKALKLVPAKHRALVDDYVSIATNATKATKVNIVRKEDTVGDPKQTVVPKLNSAQNFPALGETPIVSDNAWVVPQMRKDNTKKNKDKTGQESIAMNSKKVAPPPDLDQMKKNQNDAKNKKNQDKKNKKNQENEQKNDKKANGRFNSQEPNNNFPAISNNVVSAPPGFTPLNSHNSNSLKGPPGLDISVNSKKSSNLTFTNSMGEQFSIPNSASSNYSYLPPANAANRNRVRFIFITKILHYRLETM